MLFYITEARARQWQRVDVRARMLTCVDGLWHVGQREPEPQNRERTPLQPTNPELCLRKILMCGGQKKGLHNFFLSAKRTEEPCEG